MRKILNKGHRIRASDKHLVYHFSIGMLLFVFVAVLLLLNIKQLMRTEYSCAATPQIRQTGNRLSGLAETAYASLLAQCFV